MRIGEEKLCLSDACPHVSNMEATVEKSLESEYEFAFIVSPVLMCEKWHASFEDMDGTWTETPIRMSIWTDDRGNSVGPQPYAWAFGLIRPGQVNRG